MQTTERYYDPKTGRCRTTLLHRGVWGYQVPLLDANGRPVNFEGKAAELTRAERAMRIADQLWGEPV